jgi:hypothetical protein
MASTAPTGRKIEHYQGGLSNFFTGDLTEMAKIVFRIAPSGFRLGRKRSLANDGRGGRGNDKNGQREI